MIKEFNDKLLENIKTFFMLQGCFYVLFIIVLYGFLLFIVPNVFFNVPIFFLIALCVVFGFFIYYFFTLKSEQYDIEEKRTFFLTYMYVTFGFVLVPLMFVYTFIGTHNLKIFNSLSNYIKNFNLVYDEKKVYNMCEKFIQDNSTELENNMLETSIGFGPNNRIYIKFYADGYEDETSILYDIISHKIINFNTFNRNEFSDINSLDSIINHITDLTNKAKKLNIINRIQNIGLDDI